MQNCGFAFTIKNSFRFTGNVFTFLWASRFLQRSATYCILFFLIWWFGSCYKSKLTMIQTGYQIKDWPNIFFISLFIFSLWFFYVHQHLNEMLYRIFIIFFLFFFVFVTSVAPLFVHGSFPNWNLGLIHLNHWSHNVTDFIFNFYICHDWKAFLL